MNAVLIGYGYWGPNIARNLAKCDGFKLYGICDSDPAQLEKARAVYGEGIKYYTHYRQPLQDPKVQMCAVALRNHIAQTVAREVLQSKRHLFMEKPMATRMEDALLLKQLAEDNNVLIHVDHILVFNPFIRRIKQMLDSGEIGDLICFESNRANLGPHIKKDINAMWDLAVHDLAILDYLCGGRQAVKTECMGVRKYGDQEVLTYLTVKYPGFVAMIKSSWFSPLKERSMIVSGTKKMIVFDDLKESEKLMIYDKGVEFDDERYKEYGAYEAKIRTGDLFVPNIEWQDALNLGLEHFAACIREGRQPDTGADQAIRTLAILEQADRDLKES